MYKIKRLLHIHIILIYFTFIYSQSFSSSCKQAHASEESATTTTTTTTDNDEMTKEQRELAMRRFAALAQERLFRVKGKPSAERTNSNNKLYVPSAMLKKYIEYREEVREFVPDDRDFYGKINIGDLDGPHEDMWSALSNNGQTDIQVDMGPPEDHLDERRFNVDGKANHIAYLTLAQDPEDVSPNIDSLLPPYSRSAQAKKRFKSVHMKFNLSQEVYTGPTAADDLKGAELRLTRENIHDCEFNDCPKKPVPFFRHSNKDKTPSGHIGGSGEGGDGVGVGKDRTTKDEQQNRILNPVPRYQKIYILQVNGYDQYNEPHANVIATRRIDTSQTSPIIFNIKPVVKTWLMDPKSNYGIIVRVTNDDEEYDHIRRVRKMQNHSSKRETNHTESLNIESSQRIDVLDHVRLKRASHSTSDSQEVWLEKQPSLLLYSDPKEPERFKRHHEEGEMQADEPDTTTQYYQQTPSYSSASGSDGSTQPSASKPPITTASGLPTKRDQMPTISGRRAQPGRASSSSGRASNQQGGASRSKGKARPSVKQSDKCSKRQLNINFDEVGWSSWIIAPHSYMANYCAGDCNWPLTDAQNTTNHAIIQAIYRSVGRLVPKSSCAPVKYGRIAILYSLDGVVQMRHYDDMIVEACGCL